MPTASWDPDQYLRFADERARPALELLRQVKVSEPRTVVDLGCGPGDITAVMAQRWPGATVTGLDSSVDMIERARASHPDLTWTVGDVASWAPPAPVDVAYANAVLHWLPDHETLLPQLVEQVAPGGALAVQMPANWNEPTHTCITETVLTGPWRSRLEPLLWGTPVQRPEWYLELLTAPSTDVDVWTTTYLQCLEGERPVAEWTRGSALRPFLEALDEPDRTRFYDEYAARTEAAYPRRDDGITVLPFTRVFMVVHLAPR